MAKLKKFEQQNKYSIGLYPGEQLFMSPYWYKGLNKYINWGENTNLSHRVLNNIWRDSPFQEVEFNSPPLECGLNLVTLLTNRIWKGENSNWEAEVYEISVSCTEIFKRQTITSLCNWFTDGARVPTSLSVWVLPPAARPGGPAPPTPSRGPLWC